MIHAYVNNTQFETVLSAEHVHSSAAMGEVDHLLPGYIPRRDTHTFAFNTVITA